MRKNTIIIAVSIILLTLSAGCMTTVTKINSRDKLKREGLKSEKAFTTLTIRKNDAGKLKGIITSPFIHWSKIEGDITESENGDIKLSIDKFYFITNWPNGWTEGEAAATGEVDFIKTSGGYKASVTAGFEILDYTSGGIRYFDDYYLGDEGLKKVRERMERIRALNKFIKSTGKLPDFFGDLNFKTSYSEPFKKALKRILLAKDAVYPDYLVKLKTSGTVMRDYEEAAGLFFMDYNMDHYIKNILNNHYFQR